MVYMWSGMRATAKSITKEEIDEKELSPFRALLLLAFLTVDCKEQNRAQAEKELFIKYLGSNTKREGKRA
jgi:hypothetical protein